MGGPSSINLLVLAIFLVVPVLAVAASRLGVVPSLLAVAAFVGGLSGAVFMAEPLKALSVVRDSIVALSAAAAAYVAYLGLQTWKRQSLAHRQSDFLDELVEETQRFASALSGPIQLVETTRIGFAAYTRASALDPGLQPLGEEYFDADLDFDLRGARSYILKNGADESKRLWDLLAESKDHVARVRLLATKGQVLGFSRYYRCFNACSRLTSQYDRIQYFALRLGGTTLNFEHPELQESLAKILPLDAQEVQLQLKSQIEEILSFAMDNYRRLYA